MQRHATRSTSKRLFNSQYRIEVAELIGSMGERFTTQDLADALNAAGGDLPWSCVTKELAVLVSIGLVSLAGTRTPDGRIPYTLGPGFPALVTFLQVLSPPALRSFAVGESNITPIRRSSADS